MNNLKLISAFFIVWLILMLIGAAYLFFFKPHLKSGQVIINGQSIAVEVADTPASRVQGLSGRDALAEHSGMLFIFNKAVKQTFWMKGMKFNLDIIFIQDNKIIDIKEDVSKPQGLKIPIVKSADKADKVLEIVAGLVQKYGLVVGDKVQIDLN